MLSEKTYTTIKNPVITEKAAIQKSSSNTYVFKVSKEATKIDIKNSIEEVFGVVVNSVRVLNTKFKNKRTRFGKYKTCLLYTSPSPRDRVRSRMPSSA